MMLVNCRPMDIELGVRIDRDIVWLC